MDNPDPNSEKFLLDLQSALGDCTSKDGDDFLCQIGIFSEAALCLINILFIEVQMEVIKIDTVTK